MKNCSQALVLRTACRCLLPSLLAWMSLVSLVAQAAHDDKWRLPADAPPAWQAECGSCHLAFSPRLMTADDWKNIMANLDQHFGVNARTDAESRRRIEEFLVRNAGSPRKVGTGHHTRFPPPCAPQAPDGSCAKTATMPDTASAPRMTTRAWFKRKHHKVSQRDWNAPAVKSPANCAACHSQAKSGSYREREIVMPDGRRWEE